MALIMTDDLDMGAILNEVTFEQAIQEAVRAGNDMTMICHRIEMVEQAHRHLADLPHEVLDTALARIERAKLKLVRPDKWSHGRFLAINEEIQELRVRHPWGGARGQSFRGRWEAQSRRVVLSRPAGRKSSP